MLAREMKIYDKILVCNVSLKMYSTDNLFSMFNTIVTVSHNIIHIVTLLRGSVLEYYLDTFYLLYPYYLSYPPVKNGCQETNFYIPLMEFYS